MSRHPIPPYGEDRPHRQRFPPSQMSPGSTGSGSRSHSEHALANSQQLKGSTYTDGKERRGGCILPTGQIPTVFCWTKSLHNVEVFQLHISHPVTSQRGLNEAIASLWIPPSPTKHDDRSLSCLSEASAIQVQYLLFDQNPCSNKSLDKVRVCICRSNFPNDDRDLTLDLRHFFSCPLLKVLHTH